MGSVIKGIYLGLGLGLETLCYFEGRPLLCLPQTHNVTIPTETCSWALCDSFFLSLVAWPLNHWTQTCLSPWFFIAVTNKQAADLLPHDCPSWFNMFIHINSITHTLWLTSLDINNNNNKEEDKHQVFFFILSIVALYSQACFCKESVQKFATWEWWHMWSRCFSSLKSHQWKACMSQ